MAINVYLGYPPPNVMAWIENKYKKTIITFDDGTTGEYDWTGEVNLEKLAEAGIYDAENYTWLKNPVSIQFGTTVTTIGNGAFYGTSLTSVSMPSVTTVGEYAFYQCSNLTSVSMPNVATVSKYAFSECFNLTSVSMPNVQTIGNHAFDWCSITSVSMPNVQTIGDYAFGYCDHLDSVSMPNVQTVGESAFWSISASAEFENQTTETIEDWFGNSVFGSGWGPATITCFNGIVNAVWDYSEETWTITITPAQ